MDQSRNLRIEEVQSWIHRLNQQAAQAGDPAMSMMEDASQELSKLVEELQVAEEELRIQNEELLDTQQAIARERQRYQNLFDFAPDGYLITDQDGIIEESNRAAAQMFHLDQQHIIGKNLTQFLAGENYNHFLANFSDLDRSEKIREWTERMQPWINGAEFDASLRVVKIQGAHGKPGGFRWQIGDISQHKQLERALEEQLANNRRQANLLEAIFEADPGPLAVLVGPELRFAYANAAYRYLSPDPLRDPVGRSYEEIWPVKSRYANRDRFRAVLRSGQPFQMQGIESVFPDGTVRVFTLQARRIDWGDQLAVLLILWDTTELKQAMHAVQQNEALFHTLADNIPQLGWIADRQGNPVWFNQRWYEYTGTAPEEMQGQGWQKVHHPEYLQAVLTGMRAHFEQGIPWEDTFPLRGKDGSYRWFLSRAVPIRNELGEVVQWVGTNTDVNASQQAEQTLRTDLESERARISELQAVMDTVPALMWITHDPQAREMTGNRAAYEIVRQPAGQNISKSGPEADRLSYFQAMRNGQEIPPQELPVQQAAAGKPIHGYEFDMIFTDGETRHLLGNAEPLFDEKGQISGAVSAFIDITHYKEAEERLRQANDALKESNQHLSALTDAATGLLAGRDPAVPLNDFFQRFSDQLGLDVYVQYNLAPEGDHLELGSYAGFAEKYRRILARLELGQAVCGTVAQTRQPMIVTEVQASTDRKTQLIRKLGVNTYACHPLMAGDRLLGTLSFGSRSLSSFDAKTITLIRAFCDLVAIALERQRTEEVLHQAMVAIAQSEAINRRMIDSSPDCIKMLDLQGNLLSMNSGGQRLLEIDDLSPYLHAPWVNFWPEPDRPQVARAIAEACSGKTSRFQAFHPSTSGRPIWWDVLISPILNLDGQPETLLAISRDITRDKLARETATQQTVQIELQHRLLEQREQERQQIARDLHDGPVQEILSAMYALQEMQDRLEGSPDLGARISRVQESLSRQVAELRTYAGELRPPALVKFGLAKGIRSHLEAFQEKHPGMAIQFIEDHQEGALVPDQPRLAIFRIYQEAMNNIARHSQATSVQIHLHKGEHEVTLDIRDNGVGFDLPADWLELIRQGHLGLAGMRERTEAIGGRFEVLSTAGTGTLVRVCAAI